MRYTGANRAAVVMFGGEALRARATDDTLVVTTLHGEAELHVGDWLLKGPRDFWPVDDAQFAETYQAAP